MERLVNSGLYGAKLIAVERPELVRRYNLALEYLGLPHTELSRFRIDGVGWSPEIADEFKNDRYLCAGEANPFAIVLSPAQEDHPVYVPYSSYDRDLMAAYFKRFRSEIADITTSTALTLDIGSGLGEYRTPQDLLYVESVTVRSSAGTLIAAAARQRELIERFNGEELAWFDPGLRNEIIASASMHGDLRYRRVYIPDLKFSEFNCFYTVACKGVFVLYRGGMQRKVIVVEDKESATKGCFGISDPELCEKLLLEGLLEISTELYRARPDIITRKRHMLAANVLCEAIEDESLADFSEAQIKQRLREVDDPAVEIVSELERIGFMVGNGRQLVVKELSSDLRLLLAHPALSLPKSDKRVLELLLSRIDPRDVLRLYWSDKAAFYRNYISWKRPRREWAANLILGANGDSRLEEYSW